MKTVLGYSVMLMAIGVVMIAFDPTRPASHRPDSTAPRRKRLTFEVSPLSGDSAVTQSQLDEAKAITQRRLEVMELTSSTVELSGNSFLIVTIPDTANLDEVTDILTQRGLIEFLDASSNPPSTGVYIVTEPGGPDPEHINRSAPGTVYPVVLTGEDLLIGGAKVTQTSGMLDLQLTTTRSGKTKLAAYTGSHIGSFMPLALDKCVLVSPMIHDEIAGGTLALAGLQDIDIRKLLASANSGVLPIRLKLTGSETILIDPSTPGRSNQ